MMGPAAAASQSPPMMGPAAAASAIPEAAVVWIVSIFVVVEELFQELSAIFVVVIEGRGDSSLLPPARQPLAVCHYCYHQK